MSGMDTLSIMGHLMLLLTLRDVHAVWHSFIEVKKIYCERYNAVTSLALVMLFPSEAPRLISRIERILQAGPTEANEFAKSLASGFNLIGVAGAIITQVAITGVNVESGDNFSWTVTVCYIIGLVCAAFSVYFACVVHPAFIGLDDASMIRIWLGKPVREHGSGGRAGDQPRYASAYAVMMILAPSRLLNISIASLLVGYGIHLGLLYTSRTSSIFHDFSSLAILVAYVCTGAYALGIYFFPRGLKEIELRDERLNIDAAENQKSMLHSPYSTAEPQRVHLHLDHRSPHRKDVVSCRCPCTSISETDERPTRLGRMDTNASHQLESSSIAETVDVGTSVDASSNCLEIILQELVVAQERSANITQQLLEFHQRRS